MRAVERFDPHKRNPATGQPYQFSTYATAFIRGRMLWAIRTRAQGLSLPEHIAQQIAHLERVRREYWLHQQREPSVAELVAALQRPAAQILLLLEAQQVKSLDEAPAYYDEGEDEVKRLADLLVAPDPLPEREQQAEVSHLLRYLYPDERRVIACRYQLGQETCYGIDEIPVSYVEVARLLHLTRERVKTLEERALRKMRYWAEQPRFERGE
jgi:RNA polymerase sigma factor (sigma-70 family)